MMRLPAVVPLARNVLRPLTTHAALKVGGSTSGLIFSAGVIGGANLLGFTITATTKTHKLTDLTGVGAFILSATACAWRSGSYRTGALRPLLLNIAVGIWGVRLASYLVQRILKTGEDERLATFFPQENEGWLDRKKSFFPANLAGFWTIQALWAWVVSLPITLANFSRIRKAPFGLAGYLCTAIFAAGLTIEAVADHQKFAFKNDPNNEGKFIDSGLWALSRHPNYFGELVVWWSLLGIALPVLRGPQQVALAVASPISITSLLLLVSGVPMLEKQHDRKYGSDPSYQEYKKRTPVLIPDLSKITKL